MNIIISETGKKKNLRIDSENGIEWTQDLIGNAGALVTDEDGNALMTQVEYDWWANQIDEIEVANLEIAKAAEEFGIDEEEVKSWITFPATEEGYLKSVRNEIRYYRNAAN